MSLSTLPSFAGSIYRFLQGASSVIRSSPYPRFLLWVDAVGSFLVCPSPEVRLGQAVPGNPVEVPLLADVSRHHATIRLDGESYLIDSRRDVRVNGRKLESSGRIGDGSLIELGSSVQLRFRRPHPLSATARLDFESHHHTHPSANSIVLLADACVLGPSSKSHVVCPDWPRDVVLFSRQGQLFCRTEGALEVDGSGRLHSAAITPHSRVAGEHFSFSLEAI